MFSQYKRIVKIGGVIALFSQLPFSVDLINANRKQFRYEWVWEKSQGTGHLNANKMPLKIHENILIFYDKLPTYNPQKIYKNPYFRSKHNTSSSNYGKYDFHETISIDGSRYPVDIIKFSQVNCSSEISYHPTQKPVDLLEYLIKTYTNEGEMVLDNCAGSMSTVIACINTNRDCIAIEKDEQYFKIGCERVKKHILDNSKEK